MQFDSPPPATSPLPIQLGTKECKLIFSQSYYSYYRRHTIEDGVQTIDFEENCLSGNCPLGLLPPPSPPRLLPPRIIAPVGNCPPDNFPWMIAPGLLLPDNYLSYLKDNCPWQYHPGNCPWGKLPFRWFVAYTITPRANGPEENCLPGKLSQG